MRASEARSTGEQTEWGVKLSPVLQTCRLSLPLKQYLFALDRVHASTVMFWQEFISAFMAVAAGGWLSKVIYSA